MNKTTSGFTIVELLIVIVIIAILAVISIVGYNGFQNRANDSAVQSDLRQSRIKIIEFNTINGSWPNFTDLNSLALATRRAYGGPNAYIFCRSNDAVALVARSSSGTGYYVSSSVGSVAKLDVWPGDASTAMCAAAGIPNSSPGYSANWIKVNNAWESWFTPGA